VKLSRFIESTRMEHKSIYIGNLPYDTHLSEVEELFNKHGHVYNAKLVSDQSGMPRGYGFVEMRAADAEAAVSFLNGKTFGGRQIKVNISKQSEEMGLRDNGLDRYDRIPDRSNFRPRDENFQRRDRISDIDRDRMRGGGRNISNDRVVRRYDSVSTSNRREDVGSSRRYEEDSRNLRGSQQRRNDTSGTATSRRYEENDSRRYEEDTNRRYDDDTRRVDDRDRNSRRTDTPTTKQSSGSRHSARYQPYPST